jgi:hypothetical protein
VRCSRPCLRARCTASGCARTHAARSTPRAEVASGCRGGLRCSPGRSVCLNCTRPGHQLAATLSRGAGEVFPWCVGRCSIWCVRLFVFKGARIVVDSCLGGAAWPSLSCRGRLCKRHLCPFKCSKAGYRDERCGGCCASCSAWVANLRWRVFVRDQGFALWPGEQRGVACVESTCSLMCVNARHGHGGCTSVTPMCVLRGHGSVFTRA